MVVYRPHVINYISSTARPSNIYPNCFVAFLVWKYTIRQPGCAAYFFQQLVRLYVFLLRCNRPKTECRFLDTTESAAVQICTYTLTIFRIVLRTIILMILPRCIQGNTSGGVEQLVNVSASGASDGGFASPPSCCRGLILHKWLFFNF
jgi:hypothetical protein